MMKPFDPRKTFTDEQDSCGCDSDYDDGSDTHGSLALRNGIRFDLN
jgi:hypothetical protein